MEEEFITIISAGSVNYSGISVSLQFWYNSIRGENEYQVVSESHENIWVNYHGNNIEIAKNRFKIIVDEITEANLKMIKENS